MSSIAMNVRISPRNGSGQFCRNSAASRNAVTAAVNALARSGPPACPLTRASPSIRRRVAVAVSQRRLERRVRRLARDGEDERVAHLLPFALVHRRASGAISRERALREQQRLPRQRTSERPGAEAEAAFVPAAVLVPHLHDAAKLLRHVVGQARRRRCRSGFPSAPSRSRALSRSGERTPQAAARLCRERRAGWATGAGMPVQARARRSSRLRAPAPDPGRSGRVTSSAGPRCVRRVTGSSAIRRGPALRRAPALALHARSAADRRESRRRCCSARQRGAPAAWRRSPAGRRGIRRRATREAGEHGFAAPGAAYPQRRNG